MLATLLCSLLIGSSQEHDSKMGMTDKQIVAMGQQDFVNTYSEKYGSSTAAMCDAEVTYGDAILRINNAALKSKSSTTRTAVTSLRKHMASFRNEMADIGRAFSGGGTMWNIVYSGTTADVEETIALISGVRVNKSKSLKVSDGTKAIDGLAKFAKENEAEYETYKDSGGGKAEVNSSLAIARKEYAQIVKIAAKRPRRESDAIIAFVIDGVRLAKE